MLAMLAAGAVHAGDGGASPADIRRTVERGSPGCRLVREDGLELGRLKLWGLRRLVAMVGDVEPEVRQMLSCMRRVEMATYRTGGDGICRLPDDLGETLGGSGWSRVLRERGAWDQSVVYQRARHRGLDGLLVLELDGERLEVVHIRGRIDRLLEAACEAGGLDTGLDALPGR